MAEAKFVRENGKLKWEYLETVENSENQWAVST